MWRTVSAALPTRVRLFRGPLGRFGLLAGVVLALGSPAFAVAAPEVAVPVAVSILPLDFFISEIGGDLVDSQVLVRPGQSPATYEPTTRQLAALTATRALFVIGVPFEQLLLPRLKRMYPALEIVDCRSGIEVDPIADADPHVWMSPVLAKRIAQNVAEALITLDRVHTTFYRERLGALQRTLGELDTELRAELAPLRGRDFLVFHPAFGYFAREYGLHQVAVETSGSEPSPRQLARIMDLAERVHLGTIFVQPQFSRRSARNLAREIGADVVVLDPLARDYVANLRRVASAIRSSVATPSGGSR